MVFYQALEGNASAQALQRSPSPACGRHRWSRGKLLDVSARKHRIAVVGGGFGGLQAVEHLRKAPVDITLIDRRNFHLFQPLTYQVATGALSPGEIAYPLRTIFKRDRNVRVVMAEVADFDLDQRQLHLKPADGLEETTVDYDT